MLPFLPTDIKAEMRRYSRLGFSNSFSTNQVKLHFFTRRPPHELLMLDGWFGRAQRPHVFGPVADLDTCGQFTGQEAQRVKTEDPA